MRSVIRLLNVNEHSWMEGETGRRLKLAKNTDLPAYDQLWQPCT